MTRTRGGRMKELVINVSGPSHITCPLYSNWREFELKDLTHGEKLQDLDRPFSLQ